MMFLYSDILLQAKKIGAVNDNAPAAPTSRKLDIGESLSAYLQANIKILHFYKYVNRKLKKSTKNL